MLRTLYAKVLALSATPAAPWWLAAVAFAESSFFPAPPDLLLAAMAIARPQRAWRYALIATLGSVAGGALGYAIGYGLYQEVARPVIAFYGYDAAMERFLGLYRDYGAWVILVKGLTPIPYKVVTIASGAAHYDFAMFMLLSAITRGARFAAEAALLKRYGPAASGFIERRLPLVLASVLVAGLLGVVALRYA